MSAQRDRVLVVDDAANLRELLTLLLEVEDDFEVVGTAADGRQAIDAALALKPDVVLLDLAMPVMDGLQAIPHILARSPRSRIVVVSASDASVMEARALAAGANAFVAKGSGSDAILAAVRDVAQRAPR